MENSDESPNSGSVSDQEQSVDDKLMIDYDTVLVAVGGWGRFQQVLYHALCIPIVFATALMFAVTVFSAPVPKFRCRISGCDVANGSYEDALVKHFDSFTAPRQTSDLSGQCMQYRFLGNSSDEQCFASNFDPNDLVTCSSWVFDTSVYATTFISEDNIVCDNAWKAPLSQTIFFSGVLVAALSSGLLSDKFGRRHVTMTCIFMLFISSLAMIFVRTYLLYLITSFLLAMAQAGLFLVAFVLAMELVGPEKRVYCGIVIECYFVLGEVLASGLAYWQKDWRIVITMLTVPVGLFILYWPFLPESIRWLLVKKRFAEAQKATDRISYWNKTPIVDIKKFSTLEDSAPEEPSVEKETMIDLIKDRVLVWRLLNLCSTWLVIILGYYGLSLSSVNKSKDGDIDPYLKFFLVSLVELPGYAFAWIGMETLGRRLTMVISLIVGGVALLANAAVDLSGSGDVPFFTWFNLVAFLIGKCGLTSAFGAVYVFSSELFPTSIRTAGVGTCSTCGRLGAMATPWVASLKEPWIVMVIFGGSAVASGLLNLFLPETLGKHLPETLAQARHLGLETSRHPPRVAAVFVDDEGSENEPLLH